MEYSKRLIRLDGPARDVGAAFGEANAAEIREDVDRFFTEARDKEGLAARALVAAGAGYIALVERYAPHWLDEADALARAAGVEPERYLTYQGGKYRGINRPECFTWYAPPDWCMNGVGLFHKNRDNKRRTQCAYVKGVHVPGKRIYRFLASGDTMDMGTMFGVNERGLAIAADTGAADPEPRWRGMMNTDTMRLMLEHCSDVDEALAFLEELQADGVCAGGPLATNWMFADARGESLRVYQFVRRLELQRGGDSCLVMRDADARGDLVRGELTRERGRLTPLTMNALARRAPVLDNSNCSSFTALIPARQNDVFTCAYVAVSRAVETLCVPLYVGAAATPSCLVDGSLSRLSARASRGASLEARAAAAGMDLAAFEAHLETERQALEAHARSTYHVLGRDAVVQELTKGCLTFAEHVCGMLTDLEKTHA